MILEIDLLIYLEIAVSLRNVPELRILAKAPRLVERIKKRSRKACSKIYGHLLSILF